MSGNDKYILDAILLQDGLLKATLSMDKRNCGYLGCISGWFEALRGSLRVTDGELRVSGYGLGPWM